ncbi:MAG TPA: hypothetical protein VEK11_04825 [Thermoanaerobaculia bacterium]|jgi:hypothetical protein|nr:hypothetical protein [Thermoanaerobaculia bacterium]
MAWRIEKQANGKFAIWSTRVQDYVVIDADAAAIEELYAEKGRKVYVASAKAQLAKETPVPAEHEALIAKSRERGTPVEPEEKIGNTGFTL